MKNCIAGLFIMLCPALLCFAPPSALAQAPVNATAENTNLAAEDKDGCISNLKIIYDAIQAYRSDHKDIPNWLSDLVPQYINDPNVLICPACKRTGQMESSELADPKIPSSYLYQFCPVPLGINASPNDPTKTRRDWKRRQMGLVGSVVPIVRCRHHGVTLNLAFDGRIYESPGAWENLLTNQVNIAELSPARLFPAASNPNSAANATYPPRDPLTNPGLINLTRYYNASLAESWHGNSKNDLASLPTGVQNFAGVEYDVRGIIQLSSKTLSAKRFPARINGIKIQQKCARLYFLHAAGFGLNAAEGERVGSYVVHFATNQMQLEIPIIYGRDVRDWHQLPNEKPSADLTVAWTGSNAVSATEHKPIRLFATTWVNVAPSVEIESVDFVSAMSTPAPFLIAITAE